MAVFGLGARVNYHRAFVAISSFFVEFALALFIWGIWSLLIRQGHVEVAGGSLVGMCVYGNIRYMLYAYMLYAL